MKKRIFGLLLAVCMLASLMPALAPSASAATFYANGKAFPNSSFKADGSNPYCNDGVAVGSGTHYCCFAYAMAAYKYIWGTDFSKYGDAGKNNDMLRNLSASERTTTVEHVKAFFNQATPGANVRFTSSASEANNPYYTSDEAGHSLIFLGVDSGNTGAYFLEGNYDDQGRSRIFLHTWESMVRRGYLKYIIWPGAAAFSTSNVSFGVESPKNISSTNATISTWVWSNGTITSQGYYFGKNENSLKKVVTNDASVQWTSFHLQYTFSDTYGELNSNTDYYYQFFIVCDGIEYKSEIQHFTTLNQKVRFGSMTADDIKSDEATLSSWVWSEGTITSQGYYIGTNRNELQKVITNNSTVQWTNFHMNANTRKTFGDLSAGQKYYYQFFVINQGTEYRSGLEEFETPKDVVTFGLEEETNVTDNDATISTWVWSSGTITAQGYYIGESRENLSRVVLNNQSVGWTSFHVQTKISQGNGTLNSGTNYIYKFFVVRDGKEYCSPYGMFTTKPSQAHTHVYDSKETPPTCTEQGYTTHTCTCGDSYIDSYVPAIGHNWDTGKVTKAATCTEAGVRTYTCKNDASHTRTEAIPALGHDYKTVVTPPTCTERGYTTHTCSRCKDSYVDSYVNALGHKWDSGKVTKQPTETAEGVKTFTCTVCGATRTESIPKLTHTHSYTDKVTPPTCTEKGYTTHTCACGDSYIDSYTAPTGHTWGDWSVVKQPTDKTEGERVRVCTKCGEEERESIDKLPPITPPAPTNPFTDVPSDQYYYDAVLWAVNHQPQITNGTSPTTFSPDATCTRGQVVTFLWRAKGCPEPTSTTNPFTDVPSNEYYYKAVLWAVEQGITNGTSKTTFSPNDPCTRAHVVTFLWRAEHQPAAGSANPFTDVPAGQYYTDAVLWAVSKNITNGTSANTFSPDNPCTRGQIVTFLYRDMK